MKRVVYSWALIFLSTAFLAGDEPSTEPDRIEVAGGAVLLGYIGEVEAGAILLETDYAGTLTVDIEKVERLELGVQRDVGLAPGLVNLYAESKEATPPKPSVQTVPVKKAVVAKIASGEKEKDWNVESGLDLNGKSGNSNRFDLKLSVEAEYKRPYDRFNLYGRYAYGTNRGVQSADEIIGGGKYTNFLFDRTGIFIRGELERDEFEGIFVRSTSAVGITYRLRDEKDLQIEVRSGVSNRYEDYIDDGDANFPGMDLGLDITWKFVEWARFKGTYTLLPSIGDFSEFIFEQDSGVNLPLTPGSFWKLRLGIASQYNNQPDRGREKLDARYYARLIATWF